MKAISSITAIQCALKPAAAPHARLIRFVADRPGHDHRYAIDAGKIGRDLGWRPRISREAGLKAPVAWRPQHEDWWRPLCDRDPVGQRRALVAAAE